MQLFISFVLGVGLISSKGGGLKFIAIFSNISLNHFVIVHVDGWVQFLQPIVECYSSLIPTFIINKGKNMEPQADVQGNDLVWMKKTPIHCTLVQYALLL